MIVVLIVSEIILFGAVITVAYFRGYDNGLNKALKISNEMFDELQEQIATINKDYGMETFGQDER